MEAKTDQPTAGTVLKIGVLNDGPTGSKYVYDLIRWSKTTPNIQITHLIEHPNPAHTAFKNKSLAKKLVLKLASDGVYKTLSQIARSWVYKFELRYLRRIPQHKDHADAFNLADFNLETTRITPQVSKSGFVYRFSDEDVDKVRALNLDVLIRCGTGIVRGRLLESAKFGILSFHHADNRLNRGGPPGFWEVRHGSETTGFIIQQLTEELDGGKVLFRGYFRTEAYWLLNQANLFLKSNYYMKHLLLKIAEAGKLPAVESSTPYSCTLFRSPDLKDSAAYFANTLSRKINAVIKLKLKIHPRWHVGFVRADWTQAVMWRGTEIKNPRHHFLADPFVYSRDGKDYCFVEDLDYATNLGFITAYEIGPTGATELGTAIKEDFHLSFPYLFEHEGQLYMIPETSQNRDIRVYECVGFPLQWRLKTVLMSNVPAADTMVFFRDGKWWMLTNIDPSDSGDYCSELYVFSSDSPLSTNWKPHKQNPIFVDASRARNGGLLLADGDYYRVSQVQGFATYGKRSAINKIVELTDEHYREERVAELSANFQPGLIGTHHMHSNGQVTVFDYCKDSGINT